MLHQIALKNTPKHHNKTFKFTEGLNLIRGENESGKSSILEYIDFALHGSDALRLPVSFYPNNLNVVLHLTINGVEYIINRTPKKAELFISGSESPIASGTKPVNAEIRKVLGYSRNVFLVSNYSSQDSINYISTLKPAERKRTIDNVVGLTAVETVIAEHKTELTFLNRQQGMVQAQEVLEPNKPKGFKQTNTADLIDSCNKQILAYQNEVAVQESLKEQHNNLEKNKPVKLTGLNLSGFIEGLTEQKIAETNSQISSLSKQLISVKQELSSLKEVVKPQEPSKAKIIPNLTDDYVFKLRRKRQELTTTLDFVTKELLNTIQIKHGYSVLHIEETKKQENLYQDWLALKKLKASGSVNCNHCGNTVFLAQESISTHYAHVPEVVEPVVKSSTEMEKHNAFVIEQTEKRNKLKGEKYQLEAKLASFNQEHPTENQIVEHLEAVSAYTTFEKADVEYKHYLERKKNLENQCVELEKALNPYRSWYSNEQIEHHRLACKNMELQQKNEQSIQQWQITKDSLKEYIGEDLVNQKRNHILKLQQDVKGYIENRDSWSTYEQDLNKFNSWKTQLDEVKKEVDSEKLQIETLNLYKQKIKTAILPSVNAVASQWLNRMSEGKHSKIELTDSMDILVNGEPIEALSISGRALGHLSLRMALGQVLTNHVFPVFMADEVDASMRNERGQKVLDALYDTLKGSMKQIIMISHRELEVERVSNFIEV